MEQGLSLIHIYILYMNTIRTVNEFGGLATLNGFCTYGNNNNNITGSVGWGWAEGEFSAKPVFTVSGMTRVSKRIAFVLSLIHI